MKLSQQEPLLLFNQFHMNINHKFRRLFINKLQYIHQQLQELQSNLFILLHHIHMLLQHNILMLLQHNILMLPHHIHMLFQHNIHMMLPHTLMLHQPTHLFTLQLHMLKLPITVLHYQLIQLDMVHMLLQLVMVQYITLPNFEFD